MNNEELNDLDSDFDKARKSLTVEGLISKTRDNLALAELLTDEVSLRTKYTDKLERND